MKTLIVEDDPKLRRTLVLALKDQFDHIYEAADGLEGLEIYRAQQCEIVLADCEMPGLNGIDLCRAIRSEPGNHYCYFIMVTGHGETYREAMKSEIDDFIEKPVKFDRLMDRIVVAKRLATRTAAQGVRPAVSICCTCRKLRREDAWLQLEEYFNDRRFSHGYCPDCLASLLEVVRLEK